jgi:nucleoside-diphosphate-sugar epimerase
MKKILITGINGRIGKILEKGLKDEFEIYGIDIEKPFTKNIKYCDISKKEDLKNIFQEIKNISAIIHLAADHRVDAPWESILKNNIIGTKNIYECTKKFNIEKVIFASSNHVTGLYEKDMQGITMIDIHTPVNPDSDYGSSKIFGEALAKQYYELFNISSICLRIGSVLEDDNPKHNERTKKTWLSHRDLIQLVKKSLDTDIGFGIYYGISNNKDRFWDISNAKKDLGYIPMDDGNKG